MKRKLPKKKSKHSHGRVRMIRLMVERMKKIHVFLQEKKYYSAVKMGEIFNVSRKTIQRDIEMMQDRMGLPVDYDYRKRGYYSRRKWARSRTSC